MRIPALLLAIALAAGACRSALRPVSAFSLSETGGHRDSVIVLVRTIEGMPLHYGQVLLYTPHAPQNGAYSASTGETGRIAFPYVPDSARLRVRAIGYVPELRVVHMRRGLVITVRLRKDVLRLEGVCACDGVSERRTVTPVAPNPTTPVLNAIPLPSPPPSFDDATFLAGIDIVMDTTVLPVPYYERLVTLQFAPRLSEAMRTVVLARMEGTIIGQRPDTTGEPQHIVRVGVDWAARMTSARIPEASVREIHRFGLLIPDRASASPRPVPPADLPSRPVVHRALACGDPEDALVRRRSVVVMAPYATDAERDRLVRIFGARWLSPRNQGDRTAIELELIGTRDAAEQQAIQMERLPWVLSASLKPAESTSCG